MQNHDFYTRPGKMTSPGQYAAHIEDLPRDIAALAAVGQGLLVHEFMAADYGVPLSEADRATVHTRPAAEWLAQIIERDDRPLQIAREPAGRLAANCRHFTVLMVTLLRAQGVPARARCGFGTYFGTSVFEDHWVCEYWNGGQARWALVDAQIDDVQRGWFPISFDVTDVPRDEFLVAGQAWDLVRTGAADPGRFGLSEIQEFGDWWIAANLMRDASALLNLELLPWDCWGAMPKPGQPIEPELVTLFDRLARLTQAPDDSRAELQYLCADDRLRVPAVVYSAARDRPEAI
jgi:Transglutaminase-like superfamily